MGINLSLNIPKHNQPMSGCHVAITESQYPAEGLPQWKNRFAPTDVLHNVCRSMACFNTKNTDAKRLTEMLYSMKYEQHVTTSKHQSGHTLDVVITRNGEDIVEDLVTWCLITTWCFVGWNPNPRICRVILNQETVLNVHTEDEVEPLAAFYDNSLSPILEKHAHTPRTIQMTEFEPTSLCEIKRMVTKSPGKSCSLDTIPTWVVKGFLDDILPLLVKLVNSALTHGTVPIWMKTAIVMLVLKNPALDPKVHVFRNYRPAKR